jgi:hypothetical protein
LTRVGGLASSNFYWNVLQESKFLHSYEKTDSATIADQAVEILESYGGVYHSDPTTEMFLK